MRPFFTFYGGKWRAAPRYPAPKHDPIIEPFAGSAGYSLRYPDRKVVLVDKDPVVAGLWTYLTRVTPEEIRRIPVDVGHVDEVPGPQEARSLVGFWMNHGASAPCKSRSAWGRNSAYSSQFWGEEIRDRIASQVERIRHWTVICGDYSQAPDLEATWFVDPPYEVAGKHYRCGSADIDFSRLGEWCRSRPGQVIACEAEGASWLPFRPFAVLKANESRNGGKRSKESIWLSEVA